MKGKRELFPKKHTFSLYQKFALLMILVGLVPMFILTTFIANRMMKSYYSAMEQQYEQAASYVSESLNNMLESYNTILKLPYSYNQPVSGGGNALSFDRFREMLYGEKHGADVREQEREKEMETFLQYVATVENNIYAAHFVGEDAGGESVEFHYSAQSTYFREEEGFLELIGYADLDRMSNRLILIPTHSAAYYGNASNQVMTIGRNYFDLRGEIGSRKYVGTLYVDINVQRIGALIVPAGLGKGEDVYVVNREGDCFFSTDKDDIGKNIAERLTELADAQAQTVISSPVGDSGLQVLVVMDRKWAFRGIRELQNMMYMVLLAAVVLVFWGSVAFSRRLARPIHDMIDSMSELENGKFDIELEVQSEDEIGVLSRRFNQMSAALKKYIDQSFRAKIKQTEAELTALKSQIYPHFLYNTLEIIRMTALEEGNAPVPEMIEALSGQIHYLIGPVEDMVPLEKEISIVRKYIYLLNCRVREEIHLAVHVSGGEKIMVPRLILQPIVENAYMHGIRKREGYGSVKIEAEKKEERLEITVMDNGVGMSGTDLARIEKLFAGSEPGIKNQDDWQSIGLKNVHDRIRFLFGEEYGITLTSTPGVGTMVVIAMPYREKEQEERDESDSGR